MRRNLKELGKNINKNIINNPFVFFLVVGSAVFLVLSNLPVFPSLKLKSDINIAGLFWGTATILAIVERSIELFIAAWRNPKKEQLEQEIKILEEQVFQSLPTDKQNVIIAKRKVIADQKIAIETKKQAIIEKDEAFKTKTIERDNQQVEVNKLTNSNSQADTAKLPAEAKKLKDLQNAFQSLQNELRKLNQEKITLEQLLTELETNLSDFIRIQVALDQSSETSFALTLRTKITELGEYKELTAKYALYLGLLFGFMASIAGIRILYPLVDLSALEIAITKVQEIANNTNQAFQTLLNYNYGSNPLKLKLDELQNLKQFAPLAKQLQTFHMLDLVVSALGIAAGTKLFHGIPALISDTLGSTRNQVTGSAAVNMNRQ